MTAYELAQVNTARLKHPLDSAELKDFVDNLDLVNAVADAADGFVWRLQDATGNATDLRVFGDDTLMVNMSVWRDTNALTAFMYRECTANCWRGATSSSSASRRS